MALITLQSIISHQRVHFIRAILIQEIFFLEKRIDKYKSSRSTEIGTFQCMQFMRGSRIIFFHGRGGGSEGYMSLSEEGGGSEEYIM